MIATILFLALVAASVYAFQLRRSLKKASQEYKDIEGRFSQYRDTTGKQNREYKLRIDELSKYQHIINIEGRAKEIKRDAIAFRDQAKQEVITFRNQVKQEVQELREKARQDALKYRESVEAEYKEKNRNLEKRRSETEAKMIKMQNKAANYEATVKAMQNIINGYGDTYLSPNRPIIDELIEEYDFHEGSAKLKEIKKSLSALIKDGDAAKCDYSEEYRRSKAIEFVLDSFNGKVDAIMSRVKANNHDKLEEQIIDSYNIVNHNGMAFRNARITEAYLNKTLEQLQWAVVIQKLKQRDREEQQQIKEQMKEEARARKDYEKALKDAEKEEGLLHKAMKKAEEKLLLAADEGRSKYEDEISRLRANLEEALARSERSLSMAQQTKQGHVYIISNIGSFGEDVFKVGLTRRLDPMDRVKELGDASVPFEFDAHAMIFSSDAPALEKKLHEMFETNRVNRVNPRKEFFRVPISEIKKTIEESGYAVQWTLRAEAAEYRESCRIEKAMQEALGLQPQEALET